MEDLGVVELGQPWQPPDRQGVLAGGGGLGHTGYSTLSTCTSARCCSCVHELEDNFLGGHLVCGAVPRALRVVASRNGKLCPLQATQSVTFPCRCAAAS